MLNDNFNFKNRPIIINQDKLEIKDLSTAAAIYAAGQEAIELKPQNNTLYFVFENKSEALRIAMSYISNTDTNINLRKFIDSLKIVRTLVNMKSGNCKYGNKK